MIVLNVFFNVTSGNTSEFLTCVNQMIDKVKSEPGRLHYDLYQHTSNSNSYVLIEWWADQAALDVHSNTSYFKQFIVDVGQYLSEPPKIHQYQS